MPVRPLLAVLGTVLGAALAMTLGACGPEEDDPGYTPVPDDELFARVAEIESVTEVDLTWVDRFGQQKSYGGDVLVDGSRPTGDVLDEVLAVLWQGRPDASYAVSVTPPPESGKVSLMPFQVGLDDQGALRERYGDQPGDGRPPAGAAPLRAR